MHQQEAAGEKQATYSKTLLGVKSAKAVEGWVIDNREALLSLDSNEGWLEMAWTLFTDLSGDKFFHTVEPKSLPIQLAYQWLQGSPHQLLFEHSSAKGGTKRWGEKQRRRLTEDDIVAFCENTLGFECSLILAAVAQFLFGEIGFQEEAALTLFQKAIKYGLPSWPSISCYEYGFADRVVAQRLCEITRTEGFSGNSFALAVKSHREGIEGALKDYPSYFEAVLLGRV